MKTNMAMSALALSLAAITMLASPSAISHGAQTRTKATTPAVAPVVQEITIDAAFRAALASGNAT